MNPSTRLGFIGAGQMSSAIIRGLINKGIVHPSNITASDVFDGVLAQIAEIGVHTTKSNIEVAQRSSVIVLATKPDGISTCLSDIQSIIKPETLIVSIAAGITIRTLADGLPSGTRIVRVMPNTSCLIGESATAFSRGAHATKEDAAIVDAIFSAVGLCYELPEKSLDAVTGLSGSGPAYVYTFIESLADGGVMAGLPRNVARSLAAQTVLGAAKMALQEGSPHIAQLRDNVMSPGGTTAAGCLALEAGGFRHSVMKAVINATDRAKELGAAGKTKSSL